VLDAERVEGNEVLLGLRHPRVVGCYDEEDGGHRSHARQRRGCETLVAGHVDEGHVARTREMGPHVAQLDGESPLAFLGEPVGLLACERPEQR
jgi:hypothetical protein